MTGIPWRGLLAAPARAADAAERGLARLGVLLARRGFQQGAVAALVLAAMLVRLPLVFAANEVPDGHNDANIYFNQVYVFYLNDHVYPDADRGSGWSLLLYITLSAFDVAPGAWADKFATLDPQQAHAALLAYALSATFSAGAVAAVYLLARQVLPPLATMGACVLVAFDPYLLFLSTSAMSEPPYIVVFLLGLATVLKSREHPAWLVATGVLFAGAFVLRVNGLVMFIMALAFALVLLHRVPWRRKLPWMAASVAVFLLVLTPYQAWRADHVGEAFDYGTNQRFWADDLWDMSDPYWTARNAGGEPHKETMRDWFARHTLAESVDRLYKSVQWQVFDLFGYGKWPRAEEHEGGHWPGTAPDGSALTPLVTGLSLVAAFVAWRRRDLSFVPLALVFTLATFTWIYPLVRSVRYFSPLIPLFIIFAMVGLMHLASHTARPRLVGASMLALFLVLYDARLLLQVPEGLARLGAEADVRALFLVTGAAWIALALAPLAPDAFRWARGSLARARQAPLQPDDP